MNDTKTPPLNPTDDNVNARREFLRKSVYAAYATPVILSLLVENAEAKARRSCNGLNSPGGESPSPNFFPPPPSTPSQKP